MDARDTFLSYLNSLDERYYFFIADTVLGKISTPFHKPVLNQRILAFLTNPDNRRRIKASVDEDERRYLSFLLIAGRASAGQICRFFSTDSYHAAVTRICSLRDRLLLVSSGRTHMINPVMKDIAEELFDPDLMLGKDEVKPDSRPFADRNVLCALLNILTNGSVPVREANAHYFMKSDKLENVFPQFTKADSLRMFTLVRSLALKAGAIRSRGGRFILGRPEAPALVKSSPMGLLMKAVPHSDAVAVSRILGLMATHGMDSEAFTSLYSTISGMEETACEQVLEDFMSFGFIVEKQGRLFLNPAVTQAPVPQSHLNMDSDMEVSFYGIPSENDILYMFADINVCDKLVRYNVTKGSFTRALELGLTRKEIQDYLGVTDNEQLRMWEMSFGRISVYDGIVIRCDDQVGRIMKLHPQIKDHIIRELADGVFLMDRSTYQVWEKELAHAVDIPHLPVPVTSGSEHIDGIPDSGSDEEPVLEAPPAVSVKQPVEDWNSIREDLLSYAAQTGCLSDDLRGLIDARLILSRSQIGKDFRYATLPSASGFDYNAKLSILRAALRKKSSEDFPLMQLEMSDEVLIVQPVELLKGDSKGSVIKVRILPDDMERSIPVSSIFRITVLRWTLN